MQGFFPRYWVKLWVPTSVSYARWADSMSTSPEFSAQSLSVRRPGLTVITLLPPALRRPARSRVATAR